MMVKGRLREAHRSWRRVKGRKTSFFMQHLEVRVAEETLHGSQLLVREEGRTVDGLQGLQVLEKDGREAGKKRKQVLPVAGIVRRRINETSLPSSPVKSPEVSMDDTSELTDTVHHASPELASL